MVRKRGGPDQPPASTKWIGSFRKSFQPFWEASSDACLLREVRMMPYFSFLEKASKIIWAPYAFLRFYKICKILNLIRIIKREEKDDAATFQLIWHVEWLLVRVRSCLWSIRWSTCVTPIMSLAQITHRTHAITKYICLLSHGSDSEHI